MPRMIGLHHHMSYSPASASQSRLGAGSDNKINKSARSADRNFNSQIQSHNYNNNNNNRNHDQSHMQQKFVLAELADDSIRALKVHKIKEERPQHIDVVQVPASAVMPTIVVDSMPKSRPGVTRSRRQQQQMTAHEAVDDEGRRREREHQYRNGTDRDDDQQRHFLVHEQRRHEHQSNQVVLIMSDTSSLAGANGVPIIGRRLPSKSFGGHHKSLTGAPEGIMAQQHAAPVIGRRSHRLLDQHQQQHQPDVRKLYRVAQRDGPSQHSLDNPSHHQLNQPLTIVETHSVSSEHIQMLGADLIAARSAARLVPAKKKTSNKKIVASSSSCSSLAPQVDMHRQQQVSIDQLTSSELCMDACCRQGAMLPLDGYPLEFVQDPLSACMMPCCRLADNEISSSGRSMKSSSIRSSSSSGQTRRERERDRVINHRDGSMLVTNQNHATCQANGPMATTTTTSQHHHSHQSQHLYRMPAVARRSSSLCRGDKPGPICVMSNHNQRLSRRAAAGPPFSTTSSHHSGATEGYHLDSRVVHQQPPPVPCKPSYKHASGRQRELFLQHHLDQLQQQQLEQEQESAAVTQMYESLAAELKAKLGNPNRAPILLPPKDYDTLSRKQGKLSGIELRRSTNPQLVGPTGARVGLANGTDRAKPDRVSGTNGSHHQPTISEEICCDHSASSTGCSSGPATTVGSSSAGSSPRIPVDTSTRSSGRSNEDLDQTNHQFDHHHHHDLHLQRGDSLQRSRSNSSSGLGSISISASSPDQNARSSPSHSSGSETDMTTMRHLNQTVDSSLLQSKLANDEFIMFGSSLNARTPAGNTSRSVSGNNTSSDLCSVASTERSQSESVQQTTSANAKNNNQTASVKCNSSISSSNNIDAHLRNGRVEVPLKVNNDRRNGNTYLATKQIIY